MNVIITQTNRNSDKLIPQDLIRNDEKLVESIENYCNENNLNPIYIDGSVAIFKDYLLMAFYEDELTLEGQS